VGAVSNTNGTLNARSTQDGANGWNCQRALTVRNNVGVDVAACSYNQGDFGINIAHQIANEVPAQ
jgi:PknH-like protein